MLKPAHRERGTGEGDGCGVFLAQSFIPSSGLSATFSLMEKVFKKQNFLEKAESTKPLNHCGLTNHE
jgi:hypothetical protein